MNKRLTLVTFYFSLLIFHFASAQKVGIGTNIPDASAQLDVTSTNNGFLPPRMTCAQRNAIVNPAAGLIIYCTDCASGEMQYYNGSNWMSMTFPAANLPSFTNSCGQTWTTQNLSISSYRNGEVIPQVTDNTEWQNLTTGAWCWYKNDSATYAATYGRMYNWYAVNDPRGLAPIGWHVPTDAEWNKLVKCIDPAADTATFGAQSTTAGNAMKEVGISHWFFPNTGATNSSGFAGLPGASRYDDGTFGSIAINGGWWSSTEDGSYAWFRSLTYNNAYVYKQLANKILGLSVRLVRD